MTDERPAKIWTIKELLDWSAEDFRKRGIDTARLDAEILLAEALACKRIELYTRFDDAPQDDALQRFREAVRRRRDREPVALIIGRKAFHEIEVTLKPGLFVPRPETEILADEAIRRLLASGLRAPRLLELCSGSGAVTLAALFAVPSLTALAVDLSPVAGENLTENAKRMGVDQRAEFRQGDLFEPVRDETFDLIACNPPYVPTAEIAGLMPEVRDHEPHLALDGGPDGLDLVRRLIDQAPARVKPGGWIILEIGEGHADQVADLAPPAFTHETTRKDLRGIPRIVVLRRSDS